MSEKQPDPSTHSQATTIIDATLVTATQTLPTDLDALGFAVPDEATNRLLLDLGWKVAGALSQYFEVCRL